MRSDRDIFQGSLIMQQACPSDSILIKTSFDEGSLGVSLKLRQSDGVGYVVALLPNTQAVDKDIQPNDEVWSVGSQVFGESFIDKNDWNALIAFIPKSKRPLQIVWRRRLTNVSEKLPQVENLALTDNYVENVESGADAHDAYQSYQSALNSGNKDLSARTQDSAEISGNSEKSSPRNDADDAINMQQLQDIADKYVIILILSLLLAPLF